MFLGKTQNIRIYDIRSYINIHSFRPLIKKSILTKYEVVNNYKNYHGLFDYKYQKLLNIYTTLVNLKETSFINIEHTYKQKPDAVLCINNNDDDIFGTIIDKKRTMSWIFMYY